MYFNGEVLDISEVRLLVDSSAQVEAYCRRANKSAQFTRWLLDQQRR